MPPILEERIRRTGHYIVSESNGYRSRDVGIVASGAGKLLSGTVLGQVTATKKFTPYDPAATDGSEAAAAILYEGCDATSADVKRTLTVRDTEVQADVLIWAEGVTDAQKTAALAALSENGIVAR